MRWMAMTALAGMCAMAAGSAAAQAGHRAHLETSFDVTVHAPYAEAAALFGPEGERPWAGKHWDPLFLHPVPGRDEEGAVFTIQHGPLHAVWVVTQHDLGARHFQYVYFVADLLVTTIDVRFEPVDPKTTRAHVTYARTAVSAEGDEHVTEMGEADKKSGDVWQKAIDAYLTAKK